MVSKTFLFILKTLMAAYIVTAIMLLVLSFCIYRYDVSEKMICLTIIFTYILSNFLFGRRSSKVFENKKTKIIIAVIGATLYIVFMCAISIIMGNFITIPCVLMPLLLCVNSSIIGSIM